MKDLFGNEAVKVEDRYRGRHNAHPYPPGTGPEGEECRGCRERVRLEYHGKYYHKCRHIQWTHGLGTDLRLKDEACFLWKERLDNV